MHCRVYLTVTAMESWDRTTTIRKTFAALGRGVLLILVLPLATAAIFGYSVLNTLPMIGTSLVLESTAAPVGIALGLTPLFVCFVLICTESGIFLCLYDIFDTIGHTSPKVAEFLEKSRQYAHASPTVEKYGILGLIPLEILLGVYACAPVSWVLGWREDRSLVLTLIGYLPQLAVTVWIATGVLHLTLSGLVMPP